MIKSRDKCGVFGIKSKSGVFDRIYYGLYALQHRGQESAGMAMCTDHIRVHKDMGLVTEVFNHIHLEGNIGIGHVRYSTTGGSKIENAQPLFIQYSGGNFAIAHNGNIINYAELRETLERRGSIFSTTSDTEMIAQLIAQEHTKLGDFVEGIKSAMNYLEGSYSLVILCDRKIIAVRDPHGFRPFVLGQSGEDYAVASESCALDCINMKLVRDIKPSEILVIGNCIESHFGPEKRTAHCMFEYVYFARPDSIINGKSVYEIRKNLGKTLAEEAPAKADRVIPVPDSGRTASIGYSRESKKTYGEGLMKNRYVGRTFIIPEQENREMEVKMKLNPIKSGIEGKSLVLVDDSLVRGTTMKQLIQIIKEANAKEVHVRISSPPIRYPCHYGIDMQTQTEFIASKKDIEGIRKEIGADSLAYISLEGLINAIGEPESELCLACLTGEYPIKRKEQTKLL